MKKMKVLWEMVLGKLKDLLDVEEDTQILEIAHRVLDLILLLVWEIIGIYVAIVAKNYILLSIITFAWILLITGVLIKTIFFEKLNNYLAKTPKATIVIFSIILIIAIILSWKYFIGFILSVILAFMCADFVKNRNEDDDENDEDE